MLATPFPCIKDPASASSCLRRLPSQLQCGRAATRWRHMRADPLGMRVHRVPGHRQPRKGKELARPSTESPEDLTTFL